ncbi:MAG: hypothetical protein AAF311_03690 [Pseudomonadota bacterium]
METLPDSRRVKVVVRKHKTENHYVATSPDVQGFVAQGTSLEQLKERIPHVMTSLLELRGEKTHAIWFDDRTSSGKIALGPTPRRFIERKRRNVGPIRKPRPLAKIEHDFTLTIQSA